MKDAKHMIPQKKKKRKEGMERTSHTHTKVCTKASTPDGWSKRAATTADCPLCTEFPQGRTHAQVYVCDLITEIVSHAQRSDHEYHCVSKEEIAMAIV